MKTKILYVVVSNERNIYLAQSLISLYSLKLFNGDANVIFVVDNGTKKKIDLCKSELVSLIDDFVVVDFDDDKDDKFRSRYLKTSMRSYIAGNFLFIDTDTIITSKLDAIDDLTCSVGAVLDIHSEFQYSYFRENIKKWILALSNSFNDDDYKLYFNSGVIFVKDNDESRAFFQTWHMLWLNGLDQGLNRDQVSFAIANKIQKCVVEIEPYWNCQILVNGLKYMQKSKIIHYFSEGITNSLFEDSKPREYIYYFHSNLLYNNVVNNSLNISEIKLNILSCKELFSNSIELISGCDIIIRHSLIYRVLLTLYIKYNYIYRCLNKIIKLFFCR